jgi:hypothetical protein
MDQSWWFLILTIEISELHTTLDFDLGAENVLCTSREYGHEVHCAVAL